MILKEQHVNERTKETASLAKEQKKGDTYNSDN